MNEIITIPVDEIEDTFEEVLVEQRIDTLGALAHVKMKGHLDYTGGQEEGEEIHWNCHMNISKSSPLPELQVLDSALAILGEMETEREMARCFNEDIFSAAFMGIKHLRKDEFKNDKIVLTKDQYDLVVDSAFDLMNEDLRKRPGFEDKSLSKHDKYFGNMPFQNIFGAPIEIGDKCEIRSDGKVYDPFDELLKIRLKITRGLTLITPKSRSKVIVDCEPNEVVAIETLREMITEKEFRKYLTEGFILVKGISGKIYQIFRTMNHVKVWLGGKVVEEVCSFIKDKGIPPTDKVIAFKAIIETCEEEFRKLGNIHTAKATELITSY